MKVDLALNEGSLEVWASSWRHHLPTAPMLGVKAWWSVTFDRHELARRGEGPSSCLRRLDIVDVLLNLPIGWPVPESSLTSRERRVLAGLSHWVFKRAGGCIVRLASPPLRVDHALVSARSFRRGLEAASSFSGYCARSMVLSGRAEPSEVDLTEAGYYGVGVYVSSGNQLDELLAPEPLPRWAETPASWVFSETLADRLTQRN